MSLEELRPRAFAIAYRMLGTVSEAEDVVQEAMLRLHREGDAVQSPAAFLATVTTRLAIDELRSARARRETYVGEWLPEPVVTDPGPAELAELSDSLSLAFLVLLESLSPEQRAVFLLREVFSYPFGQIAEIVGKSEPAVRQLAVRARRQVGTPRFEVSRADRDRMLGGFLQAIGDGDVVALEAMLAEDVELHGDGGGNAPALARPAVGRARVARTLAAWGKAAQRMPGTRLRAAEVNGGPGALVLDPEGHVISVMAFAVADGVVRSIHGVVNPEKLQHLGPTADLERLLSALRRSP